MYFALYSTIWLHEIGHASMFYYYGCKENIFDVNVPIFLANSNPYPVISDFVNKLSSLQNFNISMAGIWLNIILGIWSLIFFRYSIRNNYNKWILFFIISFSLTNFAEASSYLTLSNIIPLSDIIGVQQYNPIIRIPLFILGLFLLYVIIKVISNTDRKWIMTLYIYTSLVFTSMGGIRLFFNIIN